MFLLLITFDCSTINKCAENSVWNKCYRLTVTEKKNFCHPSLIHNTGEKTQPQNKKKEEGRLIFLSWRRLCCCSSRFAGSLGGFEIGLTQTLNPFEVLCPGPANPENCSLLSKARQREQELVLTPFFAFYLPKCGFPG